jgi:hypothetical protein
VYIYESDARDGCLDQQPPTRAKALKARAQQQHTLFCFARAVSNRGWLASPSPNARKTTIQPYTNKVVLRYNKLARPSAPTAQPLPLNPTTYDLRTSGALAGSSSSALEAVQADAWYAESCAELAVSLQPLLVKVGKGGADQTAALPLNEKMCRLAASSPRLAFNSAAGEFWLARQRSRAEARGVPTLDGSIRVWAGPVGTGPHVRSQTLGGQRAKAFCCLIVLVTQQTLSQNIQTPQKQPKTQNKDGLRDRDGAPPATGGYARPARGQARHRFGLELV